MKKSFAALHYSAFGGKCTSMLFSAILPFTPKHQRGFSLKKYTFFHTFPKVLLRRIW